MTDRPSLRRPSVLLATWFGCGLLRPAPGTWGTLGAMPVGIAILYYGGWTWLLPAIAIVTLLGWWAAEHYEVLSGVHDASSIVIDEVAGVWIALLPALALYHALIAFALFRALDILKPWPIGWADKKLPGGLGVMADDIIAGALSAGVLYGLRRYAGLG